MTADPNITILPSTTDYDYDVIVLMAHGNRRESCTGVKVPDEARVK
jgi:hypothetical protein